MIHRIIVCIMNIGFSISICYDLYILSYFKNHDGNNFRKILIVFIRR